MTLLDLFHDQRLDQSETLTFAIPASDPQAALIVEDAEVRWRGRRFYMNEPITERAGTQTRITVECEALWYRLGDTTHIGSLELSDLTAAEGLAVILDPTAWTVAEHTTDDATTYSLEMEDKTALEWVRQWAKITGTFVEWDTLAESVALVTERGADLGIGFRYGRNMTQVRRRSRKPECTRLFPFGADGLSIAGVNGGVPYLEDLSFYTDAGLTLEQARERFTRSRPWSDTAFVDESALLAEAQRRFAGMAQPTLSYELSVIDLTELTGVPDDDYELADSVRVADGPLGIDVRTTVVRTVRYPLQPWRNVVELAYLPASSALAASSGRSSSAAQWLQFEAPVRLTYPIRNDATYSVARLGLRFREGGKGNLHLNLFATGVGDGVMHVEVYEAESDTVAFYTLDVPYTDGEQVAAQLSWAVSPLVGRYDWRVRVSTTAAGGPDPSLGVDIAESVNGEAPFYAMVLGAVRETPVEPNSVTYNYTGALQSFTVPDNVTEVEITGRGAQGGNFNTAGGRGTEVGARFVVVPGTTYDVYVGGQPTTSTGGWPNGGAGGSAVAGSAGRGGGGATFIVPTGGAITAALIVAPAGGGSSVDNGGGAAGFFAADPGIDGQADGGEGATQTAPGAGGAGANNGEAGDTDGTGQGGDGADGSGSLGNAGAGGGGGIHGGGGGGSTGSFNGDGPGGGGGGAGMIDPAGFDPLITDDTVTGHGSLTIEWETPAEV